MTPRRRSFYGWAVENEPLPPAELEGFETAWANLLGIDGFDPAPMACAACPSPASPPPTRA